MSILFFLLISLLSLNQSKLLTTSSCTVDYVYYVPTVSTAAVYTTTPVVTYTTPTYTVPVITDPMVVYYARLGNQKWRVSVASKENLQNYKSKGTEIEKEASGLTWYANDKVDLKDENFKTAFRKCASYHRELGSSKNYRTNGLAKENVGNKLPDVFEKINKEEVVKSVEDKKITQETNKLTKSDDKKENSVNTPVPNIQKENNKTAEVKPVSENKEVKIEAKINVDNKVASKKADVEAKKPEAKKPEANKAESKTPEVTKGKESTSFRFLQAKNTKKTSDFENNEEDEDHEEEFGASTVHQEPQFNNDAFKAKENTELNSIISEKKHHEEEMEDEEVQNEDYDHSKELAPGVNYDKPTSLSNDMHLVSKDLEFDEKLLGENEEKEEYTTDEEEEDQHDLEEKFEHDLNPYGMDNPDLI